MPLVDRIWKIAGYRPINPAIIANDAEEVGDWWGLVNSINCPRGRQPGEAHFLVNEATCTALAALDGPLSITCEHEGGRTTWQGYYLTKTTAVTPHNSKPVHWITLCDVRWILERSTVNKRYNLRKTESSWVDSSLNSGTPYTWQQILTDLWGLLPGVAGSCPTLPFTPSSTPENFVFDGMNAWQVINQVLTAIGCGAIFYPFSNAFSFVDLKATQAGLDSVKSSNAKFLQWKFTPRELTKANYPEKVVVTYHKIPGTDSADSPFPIKPATEEASLGQDGVTGTKWPIVDTMFATDGNAAQRTTRAGEIKDALVGLLKPMAKPWGAVYAGVLLFLPGSEITDITWTSDGTRGMQTIPKFSYQPFEWPELITDLGGTGSWIQYVIESIADATGGPYTGLRVATVIVKGGDQPELIETEVEVVDHARCIFDDPEDPDMVGFTGWAKWGQFLSLQSGEDCDTLTPWHWAADNRCCAPDTGLYAEPC